MGTCIICGSPSDGDICDTHEEDVFFEFRGDGPEQLVANRYYRGRVDGFAEFGVFVDVGEVTGLLHRSEIPRRLESLDWDPGDEVFVQVLSVHDNGNIDLGWSLRQKSREFRGRLIQDPEIGKPVTPEHVEAEGGAEPVPEEEQAERAGDAGLEEEQTESGDEAVVANERAEPETASSETTAAKEAPTIGEERTEVESAGGPAAEAADLRGVSQFLMDLMDDVPFATELMARCVDTGIAFARAQVEAGADTVGIGDAIASQVSPEMYRQLILPAEKHLVRAVHEMGAYVRLHICGNITHLLPDFNELEADIVDVDHMVDMHLARQSLNAGVVLAGNIDPVAAVKQGTPDSIRRAVMDTYTQAGNPHMPMAGCEIPPGTPNDNLKALCEPVPYNPEL